MGRLYISLESNLLNNVNGTMQWITVCVGWRDSSLFSINYMKTIDDLSVEGRECEHLVKRLYGYQPESVRHDIRECFSKMKD